MDRQTDEIDSIRRCPTNVERPIGVLGILNCHEQLFKILPKLLEGAYERLLCSTSNLLQFYLKMSDFTDSFPRFCLELKNTFCQNSSQLFPTFSYTYPALT